MDNVIEIDFKNKCKAGQWEQRRFFCHVCENKYTYDSRTDKPEDKVGYIKVGLAKKGTANVCEHCVEEMNKLIKKDD